MHINANPALRGAKRTAAEVRVLLDAGADRLEHARDALAARIDGAGNRLKNIEVGAARKVRTAASETERYAREHPWRVAGIALALVATLGVVVIGLATRSKEE